MQPSFYGWVSYKKAIENTLFRLSIVRNKIDRELWQSA